VIAERKSEYKATQEKAAERNRLSTEKGEVVWSGQMAQAAGSLGYGGQGDTCSKPRTCGAIKR